MTEAAEKLLARYIPEPNSGCWLWPGVWSLKGYGIVNVRGRDYRAHRVSYEHFRGPIPEGYFIDHLCRVRCCVNPDHLELVTNKENVLRGFGPTAMNARKTHCKWGHEFTPENTTIKKRGRDCLACDRARIR